MSSYLRVLEVKDLEMILSYEEKKRREQFSTEEEIIFAGWDSQARKEALEFYLPLGWSFVDFSENSGGSNMSGYFLAQPMLFVESKTQSLWVEHLQFNSIKTRDELCQMVYRLARDRHFQRIYFPQSVQNGLAEYKYSEWGKDRIIVTL